ncbi:hypothetical protein [Rhizobium sp. Leaf383]|uniref:hypothetical protein n=1 Tax=Rhizobium sp. Leaf383 TaxID=1736357 RepID=UPI000714F7C9|nr:hypothetical protein [Rhizobium sp. Leaf383]KQS76402.1 hypothetical protein ASG58_11295 [Rhizobium sp. Leaf383]
MTGEILIAMTGDDNELWPVCLERGVVALGYGRPYFDALRSGDRDAFFRLQLDAHPRGTAESVIRRKATIWFDRATRIAESRDDLWLHRTATDLYWALSEDTEPLFEEYDGKMMIAKPVTPWARRNRKTVALTWNSIHPKARDYLTTQQAVFRVADPKMKQYIQALIEGGSLERWHELPDWKSRLGEEKGKTLGSNVELSEFVLTRMMMTIRDTVRNSNGQVVQRTLRDKKLLCSEAAMKARLEALMIEQEGRCAITGLPLHVDGQDNLDFDMLASVDRIDSHGHYEPDNVQIVCRFVNFWKCAQDNGKFVELLERVVDHRFERDRRDRATDG